MAKGIDITGQGINFLVTIEGTDAIKFLKSFEKNFQNVERSVDTVVQQISSSFDRITNSMEEYIEELNKNPNMIGPGGGTSKQIAGMEKVKKTIEQTSKMLQEGIKDATQETSSLNRNVSSLSGSLDRAADEAKDLEDALGEAANVGDRLKSALAFAGMSVGIGQLIQESVEWNRVLTKASILMKDAGMSASSFHEEILGLAKATATTADEIAQMEQVMLSMGVADEHVRGKIIEHSAKLAKIFDVDRSAMAAFYAELHHKNLASIDDIEGLSSALVKLQQVGFANDLPGSLQGDIATIQSQQAALQKFRQFGRSEGQTEDQVNEATQRLMMQLPLLQRTLARAGADESLISSMLTLPERFAEEGGQRARGFLAQGFQGLGMQVNPEEIMQNIVEGRLDEVMPVFERAIEKLAASPELIERAPQQFLQMIMGDLAGQDPKLLIAQFEEMRKSGHSIAETMAEIAPQLAKAHKDQMALNEAWDDFMKSLAGYWDQMTATLSVIVKRLGHIAEDPIELIVGGVLKVLEYFEAFLGWIEKSNTALEITQAIILGLAAAPILKLVGIFGRLAGAIRGSTTAAQGLGKVLPGLGKVTPRAGAITGAATAAGGATTGSAGAAAAAGATAATAPPAGAAAKGGIISRIFGRGAKGAAAAEAPKTMAEGARVGSQAAQAATAAGAADAAAAQTARPSIINRLFGKAAPTTMAEGARAGQQAATATSAADAAAASTAKPGIINRLFGKAAPTTMAEGAAQAGEKARAAMKPPSMLQRAGSVAKGIGRGAGAMGWVGAGLNAMSAYDETMEETGSTGQAIAASAGSGLGFLGGAAAGAALGTAIMPGAGTAIGGMIGGAVGSEAGQAALGGIASLIFPSEEADKIAKAVEHGAERGTKHGAEAGAEAGAAVAEKKKTLEQEAQELGHKIREAYQRHVPDDQQWQGAAGGAAQPEVPEIPLGEGDTQPKVPETPLGEGDTDLDRAARKMAVKEKMYEEGGPMTGFQKRLKEQDANDKYAALGMPSPYAEQSDTATASLDKLTGMLEKQMTRPGMLMDKMEGMTLPGHPLVTTPEEIENSKKYGLPPPPPKGPMDIGDDEESQGRFMPKSGIGVSAPEVNVTLDNEAVVEAIEKNAQSSKQIVELLKAMKQEGSRSGTFTSPFHSSVMEWRS